MEDLERQLDELTVLQSCYNDDEMMLTTAAEDFSKLQLAVENRSLPDASSCALLCIEIRLPVRADGVEGKLAITASLPQDYPSKAQPAFSFRLQGVEPLGREATDSIRVSLGELLLENAGEETVLAASGLLVSRTEEEMEMRAKRQQAAREANVSKKQALGAEDGWKRCFYWSNHLLKGRQHKKEAKVNALADKAGLTGRLYYGKPGIVCVEGPAEDVDAFAREAGRAGKTLKIKKTQRLAGKKSGAIFEKFTSVDSAGGGDGLDVATLQADLEKLSLAGKFRHIVGLEDLNAKKRDQMDEGRKNGESGQLSEASEPQRDK